MMLRCCRHCEGFTRMHAGGARAAEAVNGVLTAGLLALFCAVVFQGGQQADFASLTRVADWHAAPACVPIIFLSLVRAYVSLSRFSSIDHSLRYRRLVGLAQTVHLFDANAEDSGVLSQQDINGAQTPLSE